MIETIKDAPANVAAFRASGDVTKDDFEAVVFPVVDEKVKAAGELNYLMLIDGPLDKWTAGAWMSDAFLGLKKLTKWHRAAILTDSDSINKFTDFISILVPGEYKGFRTDELEVALAWVAAK